MFANRFVALYPVTLLLWLWAACGCGGTATGGLGPVSGPDATTGSGADVPASSKRVTAVTVSGLWPLADAWRVLGALSLQRLREPARERRP